MKQNKQLQIRQGDVFLVSCSEIPESAKTVKRDGGKVVLAYGEVTGHAHAISDKGTLLLVAGGARFLNTPDGCTLRHEEHSALTIPPGTYKVIQQREYSPEEIRNVAD